MYNKYFIEESNKKIIYTKSCGKKKQNHGIKLNILKIILSITAFLLVIYSANIFNIRNSSEEDLGTAIIEEVISYGTLTKIPRVITKPVFEELLENIPTESLDLRKINAYYSLKNLIAGEFYIIDPNSSEREIEIVLGILNKYMDWSDEDYITMLILYKILDYERELCREYEQNRANAKIELKYSFDNKE